jgi:hypothetical protein
MLQKVQVVALEGFDQAIIGTAYRGGNEVLVYDGYIAQAIVSELAGEQQSLHEFLTSIALHKLGDKAPVFVYLDEDIFGDIDEANREPGTSVH